MKGKAATTYRPTQKQKADSEYLFPERVPHDTPQRVTENRYLAFLRSTDRHHAFMRLVATIAISAILATNAYGQEPQARQLEVTSSWAGLSVRPVPPEHYAITRQDGHYIHDGRNVPPALVERLIETLRSPTIGKPSRSTLGLTQTWLDKHAQAALISLPTKYSPSQRKLFLASYRDANMIDEVLPQLCSPYQHTDDYPRVKLRLRISDGDVITASAASQAPFMLPWKVTIHGHTAVTWNPRISQTLAALLPAKFLNAPRIAGDELVEQLAWQLYTHIEKQWNLAGALDENAPLIEALRHEFHVETAHAIRAYNEDFESYPQLEKQKRPNIFTTLSLSGHPGNFKIYFIALNGGKGVTPPSLSLVSRYTKNVLSTPWLARIIKTHHDWNIGIRIVNGRSLSPIGAQTFARQMHHIGRPELSSPVQKNAKDITLVISGRGRWLVFPDHWSILWHALSFDPQSWLGFSPDDFPQHDCNDLTNNCPAMWISPEGEIKKNREHSEPLPHMAEAEK